MQESIEYVLLFLLILPPLSLIIYRAKRHDEGGFLDLGVIFLLIVFAYAWLPLLGMVLAQHGYGGLQDNRIFFVKPTSGEIVYVGACYLAFLVGFSLFYGCQKKLVAKSPELVKADWLQVFIVLMGVIVVFLANLLSRFLLGVGAAGSYSASYTQFRDFPILVQQFMGILSQLEFSIVLAAMVFVIAWKPRNHKYVAVIMVGILLNAVFSGGGRTFGFLLAFAYMVCVSIYVKRFKFSQFAIMAGVGLVLFTIAGVLRSGASGFGPGMLTPFQGGEFFSVFVNSIDLLRHSAEVGAGNIVRSFYLIDFLRFIPQQILPIEKLDPAVWYVKTYFPTFYKSGGGLAFGAIAESVVGLGVVEALLRGCLLGMAYAFVTNRCLSGRVTPFKVFIYVWFVVISYQAVRDTTFVVFFRFFFHVLPVLIVVAVSSIAIRQAIRSDRCKSLKMSS